MAWRTFGTSLVAVAAWLLRHRGVVQSSPPDCVGAGGSIPGDLPVLGHTPLIERANVPQLIGSIRIKFGWPLEIFDSAVRPVIEGYAEYVQLLPAASSEEAPTGTLLVHALEALLRVLDYRRGQILPRGAPPEVIGAQMHRWTYAVFIAALLYDIDSALAELSVTIRCSDGRKACWAPRLGSMRESGGVTYRVERKSQGAASNAPGKLSLLLVDRLVPCAVLEWLMAEPDLMRELRDFLAGDMTPVSGVIAALVLRARPVSRSISTSDERKVACGHADRPPPVAPTELERVDRVRRGESFARGRRSQADASPEPNSEVSRHLLGSAAALGDSAPISSKAAATDSQRAFSLPLVSPEFLEEFGERRPSPNSQSILGATAMHAWPSPSTGDSSPRLPVALRGRGPSPEANGFMDWVQAGLADGSLSFNERRALVHFVSEGMLLVSPRIFTHYAMQSGDGARKGFAASGGDSVEIGKAIQREVLRAGFHVRGRKGINILTYQVMRGDKPVSRLSGVVIRSPERFVTPVPPVNPLLVRLSSDHGQL